MSDEFDRELEAAEDAPQLTNLERALGQLPVIVELAKQGLSKAAVCKRLNLDYAVICRKEKQHPELTEAFRGIPPKRGDVPGEVSYTRRLEEDPATPENLKRIQEWARDGVRQETMAALLKMGADTFAGYVKNVPRIAEAIRYGEAECEALACSALTKLVRDPEHTGHIRAVLALIDRSSNGKQKSEEQLDEQLSAEQIREALLNRAR